MEVWMLCVEIIAQTEEEFPSKIGFMNISTWADSGNAAEDKIRRYLESVGWHLVSVERAHVVVDGGEYGDVELDQIARTRSDPNAIILGTFHTYKTN